MNTLPVLLSNHYSRGGFRFILFFLLFFLFSAPYLYTNNNGDLQSPCVSTEKSKKLGLDVPLI